MSMSCQPIGTRIEGGPHKSGRLGAADGLSLAAAPTFAVMALLTAVLGGGPLEILCSAAEHTSPVSGMIPMYLLMSAFHSAPWLKLISSRGNGTRRVFQQPRARTADPFNVCGRRSAPASGPLRDQLPACAADP
jgi:hypothetical protein